MNFLSGIYPNETDTEYHSRREYVSSSPLVHMAKSPKHFFQAWQTPTESTTSMDRGTFMHKLILEQDISKYVARPLNEKGDLVRSNSKEYALFLAANEGKTPIHPDLFNEAMAILNAVCENKTFMKLHAISEVEMSIYGKHAETGLPIKARADMLARDFSFILDVKSTSDIARFEKQIFALCYDVRLAHYASVIKAATNSDVRNRYFLAIEDKAPFGSKLFKLSPGAVEASEIKHSAWMNEIAACKADNKWPGFSEGVIEVERPAYLPVEEIDFGGVA